MRQIWVKKTTGDMLVYEIARREPVSGSQHSFCSRARAINDALGAC